MTLVNIFLLFRTVYIITIDDFSSEQANHSSPVPKTHNKKRNTTSEPIDNDINILSGNDDDFSDEKNDEDDTEQPLYPCPECTQCFTSRQDLKV